MIGARVTVCALTTGAPLFRPMIEPGLANGLQALSRLMADKVTTVAKAKLGARIGRLATEETKHLDRAL